MIRAKKNCEEFNMEWEEIISQTHVSEWSGRVYTEFVPVGANRVEVNPDGTYTIEVNDLRLLIDNLHNGGVNLGFKQIKVVPSRYLSELQGYNSIVLYRGWFCNVDSCGRVTLCTEQVAYDKGLLAK